MKPLVQLLKESPGEIAAELSAVVLRNLASGNGAAQRAIVDAGGLWPLLSLLAGGAEQLVYPMPCQARLTLLLLQGHAPMQQACAHVGKCSSGKCAHAVCAVASEGAAVGMHTSELGSIVLHHIMLADDRLESTSITMLIAGDLCR